MNNTTPDEIAADFRWNGLTVLKEDLCSIATNLITKGVDFERETAVFILEWFNQNNYIELTTSGTTGSPKKIRILKQAMIHSSIATGAFFDLKKGDKALHCLPTKYIAGKMMLIRGLILGLEMDFVAPSSNPLEGNKTEYDFVAMVPLQVQNSLLELYKVKKLIIGGAKINKALQVELLKIPIAIYETYGMTETITHIAAKKITETPFSVLPNVSISQDSRNCLVIDAPRISEEIIVTNDLVELISDSQFIFLGRIDNVVNSGGIKLFPEQIEDKLAEKIKSRFFVAGIPDEILGEKLILVIESEKEIVNETIFNSLNKYEKPKAIYFVPKFIETESGKVMRKETIKSFL